MSVTQAIVGVCLVAAILLGLAFARTLVPKAPLPVICAVAVLLSVSVPRTVSEFFPSDDDAFSTLSTPTPALTTYGAVLLACVTAFVLERKRLSVPRVYYLFLILVLAGVVFIWHGGLLEWAGVVSLVGGVLAWGVGRALGREIFQKTTAARYFLMGLTVVLLLQLGVAMFQVVGTELPSWLTGTDRSLEESLGRVSGTVGHPANLAKLAFISAVFTLPFTLASSKRIRRWAWLVLLLGVVVSGLTISRANIAAHFLLIGLWVVTLPGPARFVTRIFSAAALACAAALFIPPMLARFEVDEVGGLRPILLEAAWRQLSENLWLGTGPNAYISVVGAFDAATASGLPVHNAFLLYTAELGLVLAVLFYWPVLRLFVGSLRRMHNNATVLAAGKALALALPGYLMITLTGWSMMAGFNLISIMLLFGTFASAIMGRSSRPKAPQLPTQAAGSGVAFEADKGVSAQHVVSEPRSVLDDAK
ncbi:hypothetical protein GCM10027591_01660 [Zhihengliuella somnathii]